MLLRTIAFVLLFAAGVLIAGAGAHSQEPGQNPPDKKPSKEFFQQFFSPPRPDDPARPGKTIKGPGAKPAILIFPEDLLKLFEEDKPAAEKKFKGADVFIIGQVRQVTADSEGTPVIRIAAGENGSVDCKVSGSAPNGAGIPAPLKDREVLLVGGAYEGRDSLGTITVSAFFVMRFDDVVGASL
jgi:hypothetical protein